MSAQLLSEAIKDRAVVSFRHEGERHTVEPYSLGYNQRLAISAGPLILRAWCLSANAWRDFKVKHMSDIDVRRSRFVGDQAGHMDLVWVLTDIWGRSDG